MLKPLPEVFLNQSPGFRRKLAHISGAGSSDPPLSWPMLGTRSPSTGTTPETRTILGSLELVYFLCHFRRGPIGPLAYISIRRRGGLAASSRRGIQCTAALAFQQRVFCPYFTSLPSFQLLRLLGRWGRPAAGLPRFRDIAVGPPGREPHQPLDPQRVQRARGPRTDQLSREGIPLPRSRGKVACGVGHICTS